VSAAAPRLDLASFLRLHGARAPSLQWLLGAGTSATAGVPTAWHMIWDFKRAIFCSEQRVALSTCQNLSDPALRERIQRHFDAAGGHPPLDDPLEYSHYFELAYPDEKDRRAFIDAKVRGVEPSFGHTCLGVLIAAARARIVWTTNFDPALETSCARVLGSTAHLAVVTLDNPGLAEEAIAEERWPLAGKLHGDFQSRRLKNVSEELREQDARLRRALIGACSRYGLIVCGYSGRDASVMDALDEAAVAGGFPAGLFWIHCGEAPPMPRVEELVAKAAAAGINAAIVEAQNFDELMGDVLRQTPDVSGELLARADREAPRATAAPLPAPGTHWPAIRTNALPVLEWPSSARRITCGIGGAKALRTALHEAGVTQQTVAMRTKPGVLAFGSDDALRTALKPHAITQFDLHPIETHRLRYESGEHGLLAEALAVALGRDSPLLVRRRRPGWALVVHPHKANDPQLAPLVPATAGLLGRLPSGAHWAEALAMRLDWHLDRLWLLLDPIIWMSRSNGPRPARDMDFVRERRARRYNPQSDALLAAWIKVLLGGHDTVRVSAFGGVDGIDAAFVIDSTTAYSRRSIAVAYRRAESEAA
jgi:SIR2-like domain